MNWVEKLNHFGNNKKPCAFFIDYLAQNVEVFSLEELNLNQIFIQFPNYTNFNKSFDNEEIAISFSPINFSKYQKAFNNVIHHLNRGDSYLINLTFETPITSSADLEQIFCNSKAKYKILYKNQWVCFSPESFVKIKGEKIHTFPMKGTIDAKITNAAQKLQSDEKEKAEHYTIVDLMRNDLSKFAKKVTVERLMYLEEVKTQNGAILQMSSEITGNLGSDWQKQLGDILANLIPAGSICGAPKPKTLEIIKESENYQRGFYTGIAGFFDGETLETCVLIRFIEQTANGLVYKSGGGITAQSDVKSEYQELINKIYVPVY